jgi:hypothetical protein
MGHFVFVFSSSNLTTSSRKFLTSSCRDQALAHGLLGNQLLLERAGLRPVTASSCFFPHAEIRGQ